MSIKFYLTLLLCVFCFSGFSQNKQDDKTKFELQKTDLNRILQSTRGQKIEIKLNATEKVFAVVNMYVVNDDVVTIGAEILNRPKTFITLSKYSFNNVDTYSGDIVAHEGSEAYSIYTEKSGAVYILPVSKDEIFVED